MFDTVVLILTHGKYAVIDPERFDPPAYWFSTFNNPKVDTRHQQFWSKQNATTKELTKGIYKPRLTLFNGYTENRIWNKLLKIEASIPRLKQGNNLIEPTVNDFQEIIEKLSNVLKQMGVLVHEHDLRYAEVCAIHYSKNILLNGNLKCQEIINELKKGDYSSRLDIEKVIYRNGGNLFKLHTNSWEFAVYDKLNDLQKAKISNKRSEENDNQIQLHFLKNINALPSQEILRLEARLNKKKVIKKVLKKLEIKSGTRFFELYDKSISQKVLLYYLTELKNARPDILDYKTSNDDFSFTEFFSYNQHLTLRDQFTYYGYMNALKKHGIPEIKELLKDEKSKRSWYRLHLATKKIHLPSRKINFFDYLENKLKEFKPLTTEQITENYYYLT